MNLQDHVEIVVELKPDGDRAEVERVLGQEGLTTYPLVVGVLATGDRAAAERAFPPDPEGRLTVPAPLAPHVASASMAPPKRMH